MKKFYIGMAFVIAVVAMVFGVQIVDASAQSKENISAVETESVNHVSEIDAIADKANESAEEIAKYAFEANREIVVNYVNSLSQEERDSLTSPEMLPEDVYEAYCNCVYMLS